MSTIALGFFITFVGGIILEFQMNKWPYYKPVTGIYLMILGLIIALTSKLG